MYPFPLRNSWIKELTISVDGILGFVLINIMSAAFVDHDVNQCWNCFNIRFVDGSVLRRTSSLAGLVDHPNLVITSVRKR